MELEREGEELHGVQDRVLLPPAVFAVQVLSQDHLTHVGRETAARQEQIELVDDSLRVVARGREAHGRVDTAAKILSGVLRAAPALVRGAESLLARSEAGAHDEGGEAVEEADQQRRRAQLALGREDGRVASDARRARVGLVKVEDGRRLVRLLADAVLQLVELELAAVGGSKLERA